MIYSTARSLEFALLGVLALLWGSSYLFIKIAVTEIPPKTLIAARVLIAAIFLLAVMIADLPISSTCSIDVAKASYSGVFQQH